MLLQVSRQILQQQDHAEPKPDIVPTPPPDVPLWKSLPELSDLPQGAVRWYGMSIVRKIVDWFWPIVDDPQTPPLWVSYAQLFVDYGLATGKVGPLNNGGWIDGSSLPLQGLLSIGFKRRARSFAKVLREILRHSGATVSSAYVRPHSEMIAMFSSCLAVPWPAARLTAIDRWFFSFSQKPFRRQSKELDHLPVPRRDALFPGNA